ncbi:GNAT family N-acetyltransferase [uncultured Arthrobacter sp.]|uniref:GNAT family N-acetyltransferase n=1 Tax=uncultured Arthrobacter sp. TaxID=114050 RepID=UPI00260269E9|nr:GNAT family N-acetyltransferase [uncultured Arthrobacter sp.]
MSTTGSPSPVLRSGPIELRPYTETDEEAFVALFQDPEVVRYVGDGLETEEADRALFHRVFSEVYPVDKFAVWAVLAEGSVVGHAELKPSPRDDVDGWELVYAIRRSHWRRGYGRLVASLVIRYGFDELRLPMVFATVDLENTASLALLKGLGFAQVGETVDNGQRIAVLSIQAPE